MWYLSPARVLKLEYSSEHAQVQNSKDSSQIECSIWFLHQRAISNCRQYCFGLLGLISFLCLRRMVAPQWGVQWLIRHTTTVHLKQGSTSSPNSPGNRTPPHTTDNEGTKRLKQQENRKDYPAQQQMADQK